MSQNKAEQPVVVFLPSSVSNGAPGELDIFAFAPSGMQTYTAKRIVQCEILRANTEDARNIKTGGGCNDGLCVEESIRTSLEAKGFVFFTPVISTCWDEDTPEPITTKIHNFTYVNQHGGTSTHDATQTGKSELTVSVVKKWFDYETGWHFVAIPEDSEIVSFLQSVHASEIFVYFSEFELANSSDLIALTQGG